ncbi:MAG: signal peptidase I [Actinomycetota bacterium]
MAEKPNDPWSYGVTADDAEPSWDPSEDSADLGSDADDTARHHTGRWTSPSLGTYDPEALHEALQNDNGADDAYFREFGYGEGFGDGRLGAGYDGTTPPPSPSANDPAPAPAPTPASASTPAPAPAPAHRSSQAEPADRVFPERPGRAAAAAAAAAPAPAPAADRSSWSDLSEPFGQDDTDAAKDGFGDGIGSGLGSGRPSAQDSDLLQDDLDGLDDDPEPDVDTTRNLIEWAVVLVGAVLLALVLRALVLQAFWIPSPSMESTLLVRDRVLVNKVSYRVGDIGRGDVIVFRRTDEEIAQNPELPRDVIKRVIALEGETIEIIDNEVFIDGLLLREPYLDEGVVTSDFAAEEVPAGHVFVMGDNRELSLDSRFETGPVAEDRVVGRAFFLFWPLNRIGSL